MDDCSMVYNSKTTTTTRTQKINIKEQEERTSDKKGSGENIRIKGEKKSE